MGVVNATDELYRRLMAYYVKPDNSISSAAYKDRQGKPDPRCSVYLASLTNPDEVLALGLRGQRVAVLLAGVPLGLGLKVEHDGVGHPSHCLIKGMTKNAECKTLALNSRLVR